jgi:hypothetical protein
LVFLRVRLRPLRRRRLARLRRFGRWRLRCGRLRCRRRGRSGESRRLGRRFRGPRPGRRSRGADGRFCGAGGGAGAGALAAAGAFALARARALAGDFRSTEGWHHEGVIIPV